MIYNKLALGFRKAREKKLRIVSGISLTCLFSIYKLYMWFLSMFFHLLHFSLSLSSLLFRLKGIVPAEL